MIVRAVVLLLALATPAPAATVSYFAASDAATSGTNASTSHFTGGVDAAHPPIFLNNALPVGGTSPAPSSVFPGTNNRILLDFNLEGAGGSATAGSILLPSAQSQVSAGMMTIPMLGPIAECQLGTQAGQQCLDNTYCLANPNDIFSRDGTCFAQRTPILGFRDASANKGCTLYLSQNCGNMNRNTRVCTGITERLELLYGNADQRGYAGVCSASRSMNDTPCGGSCTAATATTACIQGRTAADLANGSQPTRCVKDIDENTDCTAGDGSNCHCVNECDETRPFEASCADGLFSALSWPQSLRYAVQIEQENHAINTGEVTCTFRSGEIDATTGLMEVFGRGTLKRKVGICTGGTYPVDGGRKGTACSGAAGSCNCDTSSNGYNAGTCTHGSCTVSARIAPDRVVVGTTAATDPIRFLADNLLIQIGSGTHAKNWRSETLRVNGAGNTDANMWTGTRTGCGTADQGNCFRGGGTIANEPDGNTSSLETANESVEELVTFENLKTSGTDYSANDLPIAAALTVAAQNRGQNATEAVIIKLEADDGTTASTGYDPSGVSACTTGDGTCDGYHLVNNLTRGNSGDYEPMPAKMVTTNLTSGTALNALSVSSARSTIDATRGRFKKNGYAGTGSGTTTKGRVTFATLETALQIPDPTPPAVLPGNNRVAIIGDSRTNEPPLYQELVARLTEATALYEDGQGGAAMGDVVDDIQTLIAGNNGSISTNPYIGVAGLAVDVVMIEMGINSLHNYGTADPMGTATYEGLSQDGYCEDWTGSGYGPRQAKPCYCPEVTNWDTDGAGFRSLSLVKNANFGTNNLGCTTSNAANGLSECQMGGSAPGSPGTITTASCCTGSSATCDAANTCPRSTFAAPNLEANAPASNRVWKGIGCTPATGAVGCSGVCLSGVSIVKMMDAVHEITRLAAQTASNPEMIWVTSPLANAHSTGTDARFGWWNAQHKVENWNATLLGWANANDKSWVDLNGYFLEKAGLDVFTKDVATDVLREGIHYTQNGYAYEADLYAACLTNTTLDGVTGQNTDGVCTANKCTAGSPLKLGAACTANKQCGRYYCNFA